MSGLSLCAMSDDDCVVSKPSGTSSNLPLGPPLSPGPLSLPLDEQVSGDDDGLKTEEIDEGDSDDDDGLKAEEIDEGDSDDDDDWLKAEENDERDSDHDGGLKAEEVDEGEFSDDDGGLKAEEIDERDSDDDDWLKAEEIDEGDALYAMSVDDDGVVSEEEVAFEMSYGKSMKKRLQKEQRLIDGVPIKMAGKLFKVPDVVQQLKVKRGRPLKNVFSASENVGEFRSRVWSQSTASPARKKGKVVDGDIVEDILQQNIWLTDRDLRRMAIDVGKSRNLHDLWMSGDTMSAYFCLKILLDDYRRMGKKRIIYVDPIVWAKPVDMEYWPYDRNRRQTSLLTIPRNLVTWELALIPIHLNGDHWILAVCRRDKKVIIYDTVGKRYEGMHRKVLKILDLIGGGGLCEVIYAKCGVDFSRQKSLWECGYYAMMIGEKIARGDTNLMTTDVLLWRKSAYDYLKLFIDGAVTVGTLNRVRDSMIVAAGSEIGNDDDDMVGKAVIDDDAVAAVDAHDYGIQLVIGNDDLECLTISETIARECDRRNLSAMWLSGTIIMANYCMRILPMHVRQQNCDRILIIDPSVWHVAPNCWHVDDQDQDGVGILTYPAQLDDWDRAFMAVHVDGNHWTLAVANRVDKQIVYYDTLVNVRKTVTEQKLLRIMSLLGCDDMTIMYPVIGVAYPKQRGAWSCGYHVSMLMEKVVNGDDNLMYGMAEILAYRGNMNVMIRKVMAKAGKVVSDDVITAQQSFDAGCAVLNDELEIVADGDGTMVVADASVVADDDDGAMISVDDGVTTSDSDAVFSKPTMRKRDIAKLKQKADRDYRKRSRNSMSSEGRQVGLEIVAGASVVADDDDDTVIIADDDDVTTRDSGAVFTKSAIRKRDIDKLRRDDAQKRRDSLRSSMSSKDREAELEKKRADKAALSAGANYWQRRGRSIKDKVDKAASRGNEDDEEEKKRLNKVRMSMAALRSKKKLSVDTFKSAFCLPGDELPEPWDIGEFAHPCPDCGAKAFAGREVRARKCCSHGRVKLTTFDVGYPEHLKAFFTVPENVNFKEMRGKSRRYNCLLAPMSRSVDVITQPHAGKPVSKNAPPFYKIKGVIDYLIGPLYPGENYPTKMCLQLYIFDPIQAAAVQMGNKRMGEEKIDDDFLAQLYGYLKEYYPMWENCRTLHEMNVEEVKSAVSEGRPKREIEMRLVREEGKLKFERPTYAEVSVLHPVVDENVRDPLYCVISTKNGPPRLMSYKSMMIDTFIYPLIHILGQPGWDSSNTDLLPSKAMLKKAAKDAKKADDDVKSGKQIKIGAKAVKLSLKKVKVTKGKNRIVGKKANKRKELKVRDVVDDDDVVVVVDDDDDDQCESEDNVSDGDIAAPKAKVKRSRVTMAQHYLYHCHEREAWSPAVQSGPLSQQYITESYYKIENNRLSYYESDEMQDKLRVETFQGLTDFVKEKCVTKGVLPGRRMVKMIPSAFKQGTRAMQEAFQDAVAMCDELGFPCYFVTVTMNSDLIKRFCKNYEQPHDRPDLMVRYYNEMIEEVIEDITTNRIFGDATGYIAVTEYQKRGPPHAHIVIFMDPESKPENGEEVDRVISAELPNPETDKRMYDLVKKHMVHGPCGVINPNCACMVDDGNGGLKCRFGFPKEYCEETTITADGHVTYRRRRECAGEYKIDRKGAAAGYKVSNIDVAPYCRYLLAKYGGHINVECVSWATVFKYLFKYITKGEALARMELTIRNGAGMLDEFKFFQNNRMLTAHEAANLIFQNRIIRSSNKVHRLSLHLPKQQTMLFTLENYKRKLKYPKRSKLTAYFALNNVRSRFYDKSAASLYYLEIPKHFTWNTGQCIWKRRVRKGFGDREIPRMTHYFGRNLELFALRMLLLNVKGADSFQSLKTFKGVPYRTFSKAAHERGLIRDSKQLRRYIEEAIGYDGGQQLRLMFTVLICNIMELSPVTIGELWELYAEQFSDDYLHKMKDRKMSDDDRKELAKQYALVDMQRLLLSSGNLRNIDCGIPAPMEDLVHFDDSPANIAIERERHQVLSRDNYRLLNEKQRLFVNAVQTAISSKKSRLIFLEATAGTGKSFCLNQIISFCKSNDLGVIAVAFTGVAAQLLEGGQTAHTQFKLPLKLESNAMHSVSMQTGLAGILRAARLIVWDEITQVNYKYLNIVDQLLKEVMSVGGKNCTAVFGGKVVVFAGDWRQTLPVVKGGRNETVAQCAKVWQYWKEFELMELSENMRTSHKEFQEYLLRLGDGKIEEAANCGEFDIRLDEKWIVKPDTLIETIFDRDTLNSDDIDTICNRVIMAPTNKDAQNVNDKVIAMLNTVEQLYIGQDTRLDSKPKDANGKVLTKKEVDDDLKQRKARALCWPPTIPNRLMPTGFPPFKLLLKKNCVVMLLRNLNIVRGLVNGTRLVVLDLLPRCVRCRIVTGQRKGDIVLIPPIDFDFVDKDLALNFRRHQLPLRVAYAITINKSQGQTYTDRVGIYLRRNCFGHGQLFTAISRVTDPAKLFIELAVSTMADRLNVTKNTVFPEILMNYVRRDDDDDDGLKADENNEQDPDDGGSIEDRGEC